ncbi:C-type mannose receptor 2 isoform X5 [Dunckerocampus dactyliophorus]|uniref:C-type mannose receptor 2 isoform X5 n=1 Tax=Dunckerocampus dactyliophorus TaxID=161453 RepID=UPI002406A8DE|nr:C-type mannose receptor 2 isoform X5 [Dunckerocampus dactyliophorus]
MMKMTKSLFLLLLSECCSFKLVFSNFHHIPLSKTYEEAKNYCRVMYTDLATINNLTDMANLIASVPNTTERAWIGLEMGDVPKWHWAWPHQKLDFFNFGEGEPQGLGQNSCAAMDLQGQWFESDCETKRSFVCQASKVVPTSQTSTQETTTVTTPFNSSSSEVTLINSTAATSTQPLNTATTGGTSAFTTQPGTLTTTPASSESDLQLIAGNLILIRRNMTWTEALSYCREHHRDLVYITNPSTQNQVAEMTKNATSSHVWLGLRYTCNFNFWFWSSSPVHCYQNWAPGEGSEGAKWCGTNGAMETTGEQQWVGLPETQQLNFICQNCAG